MCQINSARRESNLQSCRLDKLPHLKQEIFLNFEEVIPVAGSHVGKHLTFQAGLSKAYKSYPCRHRHNSRILLQHLSNFLHELMSSGGRRLVSDADQVPQPKAVAN